MADYDASIRVRVVTDNSELKNTEKHIENIKDKLKSLEEAGAKDTPLYAETKRELDAWEKKLDSISNKTRKLNEVELSQNSNEMQTNTGIEDEEQLTNVRQYSDGFKKAEQSAKKCLKTIDNGAKKSNKSLITMMKSLKNVVLSMLAFQIMAKVTNYIGTGFKNLVQYSSELNREFSDLKSESATLKNSLATAFAPIVVQIIPYLTKLISWLNAAMNAISQFWAYLSGKDTYTRAKKQVIDYAKSLKDTSKSAKGALAAFDELNVLNKKENSNVSAGGEVSGAEAFEEVEIDKGKFEWVDWLKENLDEILIVVGMIAEGFFGWKIASALPDFIKRLGGMAMVAAGAVVLIAAAFDAWNNGVDWGNLSAMLIGATLLIGGLALAFGPVAAAIATVLTGFSFLIIGINDIMKNGLNLKNGLLVIAGAFLMVSSIAISKFGAIGIAIGGIGAVVAGLVLAIAADWEDFKKTVWEPMKAWFVVLEDNWTEVWGNIRGIIEGFKEFFIGVLTGDFDKALNGAKKIFENAVKAFSGIGKGLMNVFIGLFNTIINTIEGAINAVFDVINKLDFTVPEWVPLIGGKKFGGFNLQPLNWADIPYLATGGVITSATLANLGEGGKKEVVLPLEQNTEWADIIADKINSRGGEIRVIAELDGKVVYDNVVRRDREFAGRTGHSQFAY